MGRRRSRLGDWSIGCVEHRGGVIVFDPGRGMCFEADAAGAYAARELASSASAAGAIDAPGLSRGAVATARREMRSLRRLGHFQQAAIPYRAPAADRPYDFGVCLSHRCTLRCRYCFGRHEGTPERPREMPRSVMESTVRYIAERNAVARLRDWPWIALVGEATLSPALCDEFGALAFREGMRRGIHLALRPRFSNLTTSDLPGVRERLHEVGSVSLDGPPHVHDSMRTYGTGRGSYADVRRGLRLLQQRKQVVWGHATVTGRHPAVSDVYFHLLSHDFEVITVKPVRSRPDAPWSVARNLQALCGGYSQFVEQLLALPDAELLRCLLRILPEGDMLGSRLRRLLERSRFEYRCPAWIRQLVVDTDGRFYPCDSLVGIPEARMGSVWEGIDEAAVQAAASALHLSRRTQCSSCWARFVCAGGCMHQSYLALGVFDAPDPAECELSRHVTELAIRVLSELARTRSSVGAALPRYGKLSWAGSAWAPCHALEGRRTPGTGRLRRHPPCEILTPDSSLRGRLLDDGDRCRLAVRTGWDPRGLHLLLTPEGPARRGFWTEVERVRLRLELPRTIVTWLPGRLPPRLNQVEWLLTASPDGPPVVLHELTPHGALEGQEVAGSSAQVRAEGYRISIPWEGVAITGPRAGMELGVGVQVMDGKGGTWEWRPDFSGARLRLV